MLSAFRMIRAAESSSASFSHALRSVIRAPGAAGFSGSHSAISAMRRFDGGGTGIRFPAFSSFFADGAASTNAHAHTRIVISTLFMAHIIP